MQDGYYRVLRTVRTLDGVRYNRSHVLLVTDGKVFVHTRSGVAVAAHPPLKIDINTMLDKVKRMKRF